MIESMGLMLLFFILFIGLSIFTMVFWVMMLVHVAKHDVKDKTMWVILIVLTGIVGALIYYFIGKKEFEATNTQSIQTPSATTPNKE